ICKKTAPFMRQTSACGPVNPGHAQADALKALSAKPFQRLFGFELHDAVKRVRMWLIRLGQPFSRRPPAIDGATGQKHRSLDTRRLRCAEKRHRAVDVPAPEGFRIASFPPA